MWLDDPAAVAKQRLQSEALVAMLEARGWTIRYAMPFTMRGAWTWFRHGGEDACWMWERGQTMGVLALGGTSVGCVMTGDGRPWHAPHFGPGRAVDYVLTERGLLWAHADSPDSRFRPIAELPRPRRLRMLVEEDRWPGWERVQSARSLWARLRQLAGAVFIMARSRLVPHRHVGALGGAPAGLRDAGLRDAGRGHHWLTFGRGLAEPRMARVERRERLITEEKVHIFRTSWAFEAVRLAGGYDGARRSYDDDRPLHGPRLPAYAREGRFTPPLEVPGEAGLPTVPMLGVSRRLQGTDDDEDVDIALIEGVYYNLPWCDPGPPDAGLVFERWLNDPRPRVRYTALRRFRALPSPGVEARLTSLSQDPDPIVREHARDALARKTWIPPAGEPWIPPESPSWRGGRPPP